MLFEFYDQFDYTREICFSVKFTASSNHTEIDTCFLLCRPVAPGANKRNFKNDKFGYGGKKKGMKTNTKQSTDDVSGYKNFRSSGAKGGKKLGKMAKRKRAGKERRQKMKSKKK